ncbi:MAG TPA: hypothetical protein VF426_13340, partial [Marmoricola sp.]
MPMRHLAVLSAVLLALAVALTTAVVSPAAAITIGSCTGSKTYDWTGAGGDQDWTDSKNWSGEQVPSSSDSASIIGSADDQFTVSGNIPSRICNLTIGDNVFLEPEVGGIAVNGTLTWTSGTENSGIWGDVTVNGSAELSSTHPKDAWLDLDAGATTANITVNGSLTVDPAANLELGSSVDGIDVTAGGAMHIGKGAYLWSNASGGEYDTANAALTISGTVDLDGNAHSYKLDWNTVPVRGVTPTIDLGGHTLTLDSAGNSRWKSGTAVVSSGGHGVIDQRGGLVMLDGTTTLDTGTTFKLDDSSDSNMASLSDGAYWASDGGPTGAAGTVTGGGTLDLGTGELYGTITLARGLTTNAHGDDTRVSDTYGPGSVLINRGTLNVTGGTFDGSASTTPQVHNYGKATISTGATVSGFDWTNESGSSMGFAAGSGVRATTPATVDNMTIGGQPSTITIAKGVTGYFDESDVHLGGTTLTGGGTFQSGTDNGYLYLTGTTTLSGGTTLELGEHGGAAIVYAGKVSGSTRSPAKLVGGSGGGRIAFVQASIRGQLSVGAKISTTVMPSTGDHEIGSGNGFAHGLLTLAGPLIYKPATDIYVDSDSRLDMDGKVSLSGGTASNPVGWDGSG